MKDLPTFINSINNTILNCSRKERKVLKSSLNITRLPKFQDEFWKILGNTKLDNDADEYLALELEKIGMKKKGSMKYHNISYEEFNHYSSILNTMLSVN